MLYRNGEKYELTPADKKELNRFVGGKFPVVLTFPDNFYKENKLNKTKDKPNSVTLPTKAIVHSKLGDVEWRYVENVITNENGVKVFDPVDFPPFDGTLVLHEKYLDKMFFLVMCSPYCENGKNNETGVLPKFKVRDEAKEADKYVEMKKDKAQFDALLYGDDKQRISKYELEVLAKAYNFSGVSGKSENELRRMLDVKVSKEKDGYLKFLRLRSEENIVELKAKLQDLIDARKIVVDTSTKNVRLWRFAGTGKKKGTKICNVTPGDNDFESLFETIHKVKHFEDLVNQAHEKL